MNCRLHALATLAAIVVYSSAGGGAEAKSRVGQGQLSMRADFWTRFPVNMHPQFARGMIGFEGEVGHWISNHFVVGGSFAFHHEFGGREYCWMGNECPKPRLGIGALAEAHIAPNFVLDPWVGASVRPTITFQNKDPYTGQYGSYDNDHAAFVVHSALTVGLDFRIGSAFLGPLGSIGAQVGHSNAAYAAYGIRAGTTY